MAERNVFYRCGICECLHPWDWNGDCREDHARFAPDQLDEQFGSRGWQERSMDDRVAADTEAA